MDVGKLIDEEWAAVLTLLPSDLDSSARECGASTRWREVANGESLLRLVLAYGLCGKSLRSVAEWSRASGVARISDVALLKRLRRCAPWLSRLVNTKLKARRGASGLMRVCLVDATTVSRPASKGTDFRVHLVYDPAAMAMSAVQVTDISLGEGLGRFDMKEGDLMVADRGFGTRRGICAASEAGAFTLVRLATSNVPMTDERGTPVRLAEIAAGMKVGQVLDMDAWTVPVPKDALPSVRGRVLALRKTEEQAEASRERLRRDARRKGRVPSPEALAVAACVFLFTTLPRESAGASELLDIYRFRWQIEMAFKRLKSVVELDEMAAKDDALCRTFLLAKILGAILIEEMSGDISPWGYGVPPTSQPLENHAGRLPNA